MTTATEASKPVRDDLKELQELILRAQNGDATTLPALQERLKEPNLREAFGNVAAHAESALTDKFAGKNVILREGIRAKMDAIRLELGGGTPTPLERLLVENIAVSGLHLYHLETINATKKDMSLELSVHYQKSLSAAQKRYLLAMKTLAQVRKLAVPVLQVNIARKQVNVSAASAVVDTGDSKK